MVRFGNERVGATLAESRSQHEGVRDESSDSIAGRGELRRLGDCVAQHELRSNGIPQPTFP
jgi:hypothetical protein